MFWNNRNSMLDANNWFNNFNNATSDWQNRNQFGGRLGGPIVKNKTFFFFLIDEQRFLDKENFVGTVLTDQARQGNFRYFPGVDAQKRPAVERHGRSQRQSDLERCAGYADVDQLFSLRSEPQGLRSERVHARKCFWHACRRRMTSPLATD